MVKLLIFIILCTTVFFKGVLCERQVNLDGEDEKIVGGTATTIENYPYQAYLLLYNGSDYFQCGGSIISSYFIVTAAHCLVDMETVYVRIGSTNSDTGGYEYETSYFTYHPLYDASTSDYDVGIVGVPEGMTLDGYYARAIMLVEAGHEVRQNETIVITGWGDTAENGNTTNILRVTTVPVVSRMQCNRLLGGGVTRRMFCAGLREGGRDTCQGDSGGPAVEESTGNLAGATSYGYGCARPNSPGVYTNLGNRAIRYYITLLTGI